MLKNKYIILCISTIILSLLYYIMQEYHIEENLYLKYVLGLVWIGHLAVIILPTQYSKMIPGILFITGSALFINVINTFLIISFIFTILYIINKISSNLVKSILLALLIIILVLLKIELLSIPYINPLVYTILGTMLIYRLTLYFYEKRYNTSSENIFETINYFLIPSNIFLYLLPAVDYKTFITNSSKSNTAYLKGINWITLSIFHLLLYRIVYYYATIPTENVQDIRSLLHYSIANYLLIIRLSGIFHFTVGSICLLGYDLPQAFNNYFLANSFSDLWRRINIYFREFIIKIFYYPILFRIKKIGIQYAVPITIIALFIISWMLHSYQWFWIKGQFPIKIVDGVFWTIFGILVAINSIIEIKKAKTQKPTSLFNEAVIETSKILGMFLIMTQLWALWSATSIQDWYAMIKSTNIYKMQVNLWVAIIITITYLLGVIIFYAIKKLNLSSKINPIPNSSLALCYSAGFTLLMLFPLSNHVQNAIESITNKSLDGFLSPILNEEDRMKSIEGYYNNILIGNELTSQINNNQNINREQFRFTEGAVEVNDFREIAQKPNTSFKFKDKQFTINNIGIRDKNYAIKKDSGDIRIIMLGSSFVVGSGVEDPDVFDFVLENKLNTTSKIQFELLNAGSPGYDLIDAIVHYDMLNLGEYDPDYIVYFTHGIDINKTIKDIVRVVKKKIPVSIKFINDIIENENINSDMTEYEIVNKLKPYGETIIMEGYKELKKRCKNDQTPVCIYWPIIDNRKNHQLELEITKRITAELGFIFVDLSEVYDNYKTEDLIISKTDTHPNKLGHSLIADTLFELIYNKNILNISNL